MAPCPHPTIETIPHLPVFTEQLLSQPWSHSQTTLVSFPDNPGLIPRQLWSHSQTTLVSFPDNPGLIPRQPWSHSETTLVSFPDNSGLIPRQPWSHSQTTLVSFPDNPGLIPRRFWSHSQTPKLCAKHVLIASSKNRKSTLQPCIYYSTHLICIYLCYT